MPLQARLQQTFNDSAQTTLAIAQTLCAPIEAAAQALFDCLMQEGKALACGNGVCAAAAQHFCAALLNRFEHDRPALPAIALVSDPATLTAIANDQAYAEVFARQISALGQPGDMLLAISTRGHAANVLKAVHAAHAKEMRVIALTGGDGGALAELLLDGDVLLCVPSESMARIQEAHALILNCLCDSIDYLLLGA